MYGAHASFYPDAIGLTVVFVSVAVFFAAVYFGLGMVYRVFAGPEMDHEATRRAVEQHTGIPLSELPLIYVGQRRLPPDEQVLLPQMCGLYNLLAQRGVPMPVHQWRSLTQLAVDALTTMHHADVRLQKILDVEAPTDKPRARARADNGGAEWGAAQLFPPLRPLVSDDTEETHPARGRLWTLSRALQGHVAQLSQWTAMRHVRVSEPGAGARPSDVGAAEHEQGEVEAELGGTTADEGAGDDLGAGKRRRVSAT